MEEGIEPQIGEFMQALASLPPGGKLPLPRRMSEYIAIRRSLEKMTDERSARTRRFLDLIAKHAYLGNVAFPAERS